MEAHDDTIGRGAAAGAPGAGPMTAALAVLGLVLLTAGGEALVRGASRLALGLGISPLVIGLTVVAFGTSAPELAVSVRAAFTGGADLALGNVVGSNIFNVLFVLGGSALITPLAVAARLVRVDVPLLIAASLGVWFFAWDGGISRPEGLVLLAGVVAYTVLAIQQSRRETAAVRQEYAGAHGGGRPRSAADWAVDVGLVVGGLVLLVIGAGWLVEGAVALARWLGVSELVIGLTIVAAGTSLPEVAASFVAAARGERDIAVGNVVGSCLFNLLAVLGAASALAPSGIGVPAAALAFDIPVMAAVAVACLPVLAPLGVARWQGGLLLGWYAAYVLYLVLDTQGHEAVDALSAALAWFALPLTAVTLGILGWRGLQGSRGPSAS